MMIRTLIASAIGAAFFCNAPGAQAQSGGDPFAQMLETRVIPGWRMADGRHMAALELKLAKGWKTYWRAPGDAGIPPLFNWSGSGNFRSATVTWPTPGVFHQSGARSVGYQDNVVLPITITPKRKGKQVRLQGVVDLGVCREVCVPVRVKVDEILPATNAKPDPAIAAALADRPFSGEQAGLISATCEISPTRDGLSVTARFALPSTGGREAGVVETGDPLIWASVPKLSRKGRALSMTFDLLHANGGGFSVDRSALRFTVLGKNHAVDIRGCTG